MRLLKEIQGHMRLHASGDRHQIRQEYLPLLWQKLVNYLNVNGKDGVPDIIPLMDSYFLTKDDWDAVVELGVGPMNESQVKLDTQTKATFTRMYNQQNHPLPFIRASQVMAPKKVKKDVPDLEEAMGSSDEGDAAGVSDEEGKVDDEQELDLKKDKYVKAPSKKKMTAAKKGEGAKTGMGKGKAKAKGKFADENQDDQEGEEESKKPPLRGPTKGKGGRPKKKT